MDDLASVEAMGGEGLMLRFACNNGFFFSLLIFNTPRSGIPLLDTVQAEPTIS
jgi:hypothetical protein